MRIEVYNNGAIIKVIKDDGGYYYYDPQTKTIIPNNSNSLINLISNVLQIHCAILCQGTPVADTCCTNSLLTNAGNCIMSNAGLCIVSNNG